jgi:PAS domain S-box-containing protein
MPLASVSIITLFLLLLNGKVPHALGANPFLFAVVLSAWKCGILSGVIATLFGAAVGIYFFVEPLASFRLSGSEVISMTFFVLECLAFIGLIAMLRRSVGRLKKFSSVLAKRENEFRTMFENAAIGMAKADPTTGRFIRVNQCYCELTGYSFEALYQMSFRDLTHPEDRDNDVDLYKRMVRGEDCEYKNEKRYVRKDGSVIWVMVSAVLIRDEEGQPLQSIAAIVDITKRKQAEEQLMESESHFREFAENIQDVFWTVQDDRIEYVSPAFEKIWGRPAESIQGDYSSFLEMFHPEDKDAFVEAKNRYQAGFSNRR